MKRAYYSNYVDAFAVESPDSILGQLARNSDFGVEQTQKDAWLTQIDELKRELVGLSGTIHGLVNIFVSGEFVVDQLILGHPLFEHDGEMI